MYECLPLNFQAFERNDFAPEDVVFRQLQEIQLAQEYTTPGHEHRLQKQSTVEPRMKTNHNCLATG